MATCLAVRRLLLLTWLFGCIPWMGFAWYIHIFLEHPRVCHWRHETDEQRPIPKHIHRLWKTKNIPDQFQTMWQNCIRLNPGYNLSLWTDNDLEAFIHKNYPWFISTYQNYPYPIERVDAARYFVMYHYGGIYLDMDVDCKVPFNEMFQNLSKITHANVITGAALGGGMTNSFFASKTRHPFLYNILHVLIGSNGWYLTPYFSVLLSTGPMFMTKNYYKYPCKDDIYIMYHNNYTQHTHASTWHNDDGTLIIWIYYHSAFLLKFVCVALVISTAIYRFRRRRKLNMKHNGKNILLPMKNGIHIY